MRNLPLLYLAGPITGESWEGATQWRDDVAAQLQGYADCASPLRGKDYLLNEVSIADSYERHMMSTQKSIFNRDFYDVKRCDGLFVNFLGAKRVSIGTVMEITYAWEMRKPIIVVMDDDNIHQHSMLREASGWIVPTLDEGIYVARSVFR